jgi:hypothetical protein
MQTVRRTRRNRRQMNAGGIAGIDYKMRPRESLVSGPEMAPVLNKMEREMVIVMVEEKSRALVKQIGMGIERDVRVQAPESRRQVARQHHLVDWDNDATAYAIMTRVGGSVEKVGGVRVGVKWPKEFEVNQYIRVKIVEAFWKAENSAYAASAVA